MSEQDYLLAKAHRSRTTGEKVAYGAGLTGLVGWNAGQIGQFAADARGEKITNRAQQEAWARGGKDVERANRAGWAATKRFYNAHGGPAAEGQVKGIQQYLKDRHRVIPSNELGNHARDPQDYADMMNAQNRAGRIGEAAHRRGLLVRSKVIRAGAERTEREVYAPAYREASKFNKPLRHLRRGGMAVGLGGAAAYGTLRGINNVKAEAKKKVYG